jgi:uncharacterized protein YecT (DUF1311 family)
MKRLFAWIALIIAVSFLINIHFLCAEQNNSNSLQVKNEKFEFDYSLLTGNQKEMNEAAYKEFKRADDKLNEFYQQILIEYKKNKQFLEKLAEAEKAWIKFRDAQLEALYPGDDKQLHYGSVFPMCYYIEKANLTWARVKQLNEWLKEPEEGTVGLGSRGAKEP